jgi:hypothetical protein
MATPIKSLFPPIEKKPFLLNKQKAGAVARRRVSTEWRLHWGLRVEPTACVYFHLLFLIAIYFWALILFALFILCNIYCDSFQFFISSHTYILFICVFTHFTVNP